MKARPRKLLEGLRPVSNEKIRFLILGSFPGRRSLQDRQYYAHKQNRLWKFVGSAIDVDLINMTYAQRLETLLANKIGLWDVIAKCRRTGSLDKGICDVTLNDFRSLKRKYPQLKRIGFNGGKAAAYSDLFAGSGVEIVHLPSTSPANTGMSEAAKIKSWKKFLTEK